MCWRNAATPGPMRRVAPGYPLVARQGLAALLTHAGIHVLASVGGGAALLREAALTRPDVVILDVRMPPSFSDEGIGTALLCGNASRASGSWSCRPTPSQRGCAG